MRSVLELTNTITSTSGIANLTPEVWSAEVEQQGEDLREARNWIKVDRSLVGRPGDVAHVLTGARLTTSSDVETGKVEAADATFYALDDFTSVDLTPAPYYSAVQVSEDVVEEVNVDVLAEANRLLAEVLAQYEDEQILSSAATNATNNVYGGDATSDGTIDTGDIFTTAMFKAARREIKKDRYKPDVCFMNADAEYAILEESQFISAAEYGDGRVIRTGEIGTYLGVANIVTENVPTITPNSGTGHAAIMWDSRKGPVIALKHDIRIKSDYYVPSGNYRIVARTKFAIGTLFTAAMCKISYADA